jgi:hypothetical protein
MEKVPSDEFIEFKRFIDLYQQAVDEYLKQPDVTLWDAISVFTKKQCCNDLSPLKENEKLWTGKRWLLLSDGFHNIFSWAVPTKEAIQNLCAIFKEHQVIRICSPGAGRALWERLLSDEMKELQIIPSDISTEPEHEYMKVEKYPGVVPGQHCDALMLIMPHFKTSFDAQCLKQLKFPRIVVFVGEIRGATTGTKKLTKLLDKNYKEILEIELPNCEDEKGFDRYLTVYLCNKRN